MKDVVAESLFVLRDDVRHSHEGVHLAAKEEMVLGAGGADENAQSRDLAVLKHEAFLFQKGDGFVQGALDSLDRLGLALVD